MNPSDRARENGRTDRNSIDSKLRGLVERAERVRERVQATVDVDDVLLEGVPADADTHPAHRRLAHLFDDHERVAATEAPEDPTEAFFTAGGRLLIAEDATRWINAANPSEVRR